MLTPETSYSYSHACMVAATNLLSKYTILYRLIITLVVTIQSVARRWTAIVHISLRKITDTHLQCVVNKLPVLVLQ